jgi:holliday junction DNA helicase RuvA
MIASLTGVVKFPLQDGIVVEVNGVGYLVFLPAPLRDRLKIGDSVFLFTYHVLREDTSALYGFDTLEGRNYFQYLTSVDGVGPKLALSILSVMNPDAIRRAIFSEQPDLFLRVPGVGKKTAQKIQLYLKDKVARLEGAITGFEFGDIDAEIIEALTALGYSVVEAQAAIQSIPKDASKDLEERLRLALQYYSG